MQNAYEVDSILINNLFLLALKVNSGCNNIYVFICLCFYSIVYLLTCFSYTIIGTYLYSYKLTAFAKKHFNILNR